MKKNLVSLLVMLLTCTYSFAKDVQISSGSVNCLKEEVTAVVEFDFSSTTWGGKKEFKAWCGDEYEERIKVMKEAFIASFNDNTKGMKVSKTAADAAYKMKIVVKDMDRHQAAAGFWGQGKFCMTGTITIVAAGSNQEVCVIKVDGYGWGSDYNYTDGMGKCFTGLAKQVTKLK